MITKLIYSDMLPESFSPEVVMFNDPREFSKAAGIWDYDALKPDKGYVGFHLAALGEMERYGFNRNADGFPKKACEERHDTFVKNGHVYKHHQNKDPQKASGSIIKSAYLPEVGRIDLFITACIEKCAEELEKFEKTGELSFSMACMVPNDRCIICNTLRKSASDPKQCEHVKMALGTLLDDGQYVGVANDEPRWFDISFVRRPADRIAWSLKKVDGTMPQDSISLEKAGGTMLQDSISLAQDAGIWVPSHMLEEETQVSTTKQALARLLTDSETQLRKIALSGAENDEQRRLFALRKSAATRTFDDTTISELRRYEPKDVFAVLADNGIVMDPATYCKYAMGPRINELGYSVEEIITATRNVFTQMAKRADLLSLACADATHDVDSNRFAAPPKSLVNLVRSCLSESSLLPKYAEQRAIDNAGLYHDAVTVADGYATKIAAVDIVNPVAIKYASYKLSAASAISRTLKSAGSNAEISDELMLCMAAQNIYM